MALPPNGRFSFGQTSPLTTQLANLIQNYPAGPGIVKEFLQNADDAGARALRITMDWRDHGEDLPEGSPIKPLLGPALLLSNDQEFTDPDFDNIKELGKGGKRHDTSKTGRFGLGFNTAYNITDYPSFLSRSWMICFDPHQDAVAETNSDPGIGYVLPQLRTEHPAWLRSFEAGGLAAGAITHEGTIFRLPLREQAQAKKSKISQLPFDKSALDAMMKLLIAEAAAMLLFTRHVMHLSVSEIDNHGRRTELLSVETQNPDDVAESRARVLSLEELSLEELRARRKAAGAFAWSPHRHEMRVRTSEGESRSLWHVLIGYFVDAEGALLDQAEKLKQLDGKAAPEVGIAISLAERKGRSIVAEPAQGRLYCSLPLSAPSGLPVHINGYFDLDGSRTALTSDPSAFQKGERLKWNQMLLRVAVPEAYAAAIASLPEAIAEASIANFYLLWPEPDRVTSPLLREAVTPIYGTLAKTKVFRCATAEGSVRRTLVDLQILPSSPEAEPLAPALLADGLTLPDPPLPSRVTGGARAAGIPLTTITPKYLRERWRRNAREVWDLSSAPFPALQRRDWLEAVTRFMLSESKVDLRGLPLALLANGRLSSFSTSTKPITLLGDEEQMSIFRDRPQWFIEPAFCAATGLRPQPEAGFVVMTPEHVLLNLNTILPKVSPGASKTWSPDGEAIPNAEWLAKLLIYLNQHSSKVDKNDLKSFSLIPDQNGCLHTPHHPRSPLLRPDSLELNNSMMRLGIPIVTGPANLVRAVEDFGRAFAFGRPFVRSAAGVDLVDALEAYADMWRTTPAASDPEVFSALLDVFSGVDCIAELDDKRLATLKRLPIIPTTDGGVLAASDPSLFLPTGEQPPPFASPLRVARTGTGVRWRPLLEKLEIQPLELENLVTRVLLPGYAKRSPEEQREVLRFLRGAYDRLLDEAKSESRRRELWNLIAAAPLVYGNDGALHAAKSLYEPDSEAVRLLGDVAVVPDVQHYADDRDRWLKFFRYFGMSSKASAGDLWTRVERLAATGGAGDAHWAIDRVYAYLKKNWDNLREAVVESHASATSLPVRRTFASALKETAFFRALKSDEKGAFPGFRQPDNRLFCFAELHPRIQGHLVASQKPLIPDEPPREMQSDLGMLPQPPIDVVKAHFSSLLKMWEEPSHSGLKVEAFEKSLQAIYRFFARDAAQKRGLQLTATLLKEYGDIPCIWHRKKKLFVKPRDAFAENVSFFEPIKVCVAADPDVAVGLDALGRRARPELEDFVDFLHVLCAVTEGRTCSETEMNQALHALSVYGETSEPVPADLPVVTSKGYLIPLAHVFNNDAPHWQGRLELDRINVIHPSVHARVMHEAPRLSKAVDEVLDTEPQVSLSAKLAGVCKKLRETLHSAEFTAGLRRLVGQEHRWEAKDFVPILDLFDLRPALSIRTSLCLREGALRIGGGDVRFFVDLNGAIIWIATPSLDSLYFELAKAINRLNGRFQLSDLSSLERILEVPLERIEVTLDSRGVPRLDGGSAFNWRDDGADDTGITEDHDMAPLDEGRGEISPYDEPAGISFDEELGTNTDLYANEREEARSAAKEFDQRNRALEKFAGDGGNHPRFSNGDSPRESRGGALVPGFGSDDAPPIQPGHGTSAVKFPPSQTPIMTRAAAGAGDAGGGTPGEGAARARGRFATYVASGSSGEAPSDDGGARTQHIDAVDQAAVGHALKHEQRAGRRPEPMHHKNPGYDVKSTDDAGNIRYIEVKGISGRWDVAGVAMSARQFAFALEHGEQAWLYVVENALNERETKVHLIQDPARKVSQFFFDGGWIALAEEETVSARGGDLQPAVGLTVVLSGGEAVVIEAVESFGALSRLTVRSADGATRTVVWRPDMRVIRPEE